MLQLLSPDGTRLAAAETLTDEAFAHSDSGLAEILEAYAAELDRSRLETAYRHMALTRAFDEQATSLQRQGELGLWAPSRGQEAAQVGSALAIPPSDMVFPSYREHAVAHVRGLDLRELMPVFRGSRHGGWDPRAHNFHLYTFVIGAHTLHAVGYAEAIQQGSRPNAIAPDARTVTVYFGDGATSQGDVSEAMVFAASAQAPVLFFCQNNQWAISVPTVRQSRIPLARRADGFGIPRLRVDGNDVIASYAATRFAQERIAAGAGPYFIEAVTYRMGAHTTSDDPTRYRTREEEAEWAAKDPISRLRTHLESLGTPPDFFAALGAEAETLSREIREFVRANAGGEFTEIFENVYGTDHLQIDADRAAWAAYRAREENYS